MFMKQKLLFGTILFWFIASTSSAQAFDWHKIDVRKVRKAIEFGKKFRRAIKPAEDLLPEQEYYVGRSVAARVLAEYRPSKDLTAHQYVNKVGQALALASDRPDTFGGYRFIILDTDEINGIACPGGFIFITRGLLQSCRNEDELASVLAHEIAHVVYKHGLRSIKANRWADVGAILVGEASNRALRDQRVLRQVTKSFSGGVDDLMKGWVRGKHSRETELVADRTAVSILKNAGYNPSAFVTVLERLQEKQAESRSSRGLFATHPQPATRIAAIKPLIGVAKPVIVPEVRAKRFADGLAKLLALKVKKQTAKKDRGEVAGKKVTTTHRG